MTDDLDPFFFRLATHIDPSTSTPDGCWQWTAATDDRDRPRIWLDGQSTHARSLIADICNTTEPHRCSNPRCINPHPHRGEPDACQDQ